MAGDRSDEELDDQERALLRAVEEHRWQVTGVADEDEHPDWAFSIGLFETFDHPEIVVFGRRIELMHSMINCIGERVRAGDRFAGGDELEGLIEGYRCTLRPVRQRWYRPFLGWATWFHRGTAFPVLQCFWPDREQRYPWEKGYPEALAESQPLLFHDDPDAARAGELLAAMGIEPEEE